MLRDCQGLVQWLVDMPSLPPHGRFLCCRHIRDCSRHSYGRSPPLLPFGRLQLHHPFSLPEEGFTSVKIYNILGKEVRNVTNNIFERGLHSVRWDGRDNRGIAVASGVYIMRLMYGEFSQAKKILLIK